MEIDPVVEETAKKNTKKRARSKPAAKKGPGVIILGANHFACSYSGRVVERVILVPGIKDAAFANIPCAFSWIEENVKDAEKQQALKQAVCDEYEQSIETVVRAPHREYLQDFGGKMGYDEWIGPLKFWDVFTSNSGSTVKDYNQSLKGGASKRGAGRVTFESAMYVLAHGKNSVKIINALDGAVEKGAKERLTPVAALRKLHSFIAKNGAAEAWDVQSHSTDGIFGFYLTPKAGVVVDDKLFNNVASQITGVRTFGPAVLTFTRKTSIKV